MFDLRFCVLIFAFRDISGGCSSGGSDKCDAIPKGSRFATDPAHARSSFPPSPERKRLEEFVEERRRFIRDTDELIGCLTLEFEI
jgi:hypothetical protein